MSWRVEPKRTDIAAVPPPRILVDRQFNLEEIEIRISRREWNSNSEFDGHVEAAWRDKRSEAAKLGHDIWDGTYYRVENVDDIGSSPAPLTLQLGTIPYRYIATYRLLHETHKRLGLEDLNHLSIASLIRTTDGYYVFGRRKRNGATDLIGGGVQHDELAVSTGHDLRKTIYKEIREEIGVPAATVSHVLGVGIVLSGNTNVTVIPHIRLRASKLAVEAVFEHREDDEMVEPIFVHNDELTAFLKSLTDYRTLLPELLTAIN